ncbi:DUF4350 domain-containing protein [Prosthecobacter sp. SYSU 5D2]|uniref:DUF4350 domain-containing protein n=1 Tax=Prosthecobacter sp. SYSU 5D2 TaxID=3134134 RepID=UPI0031FE952F
MRLEDLTIVLRPRMGWEAADLGCTLVRRDYGRILLLWLITAVPVWLMLAGLLRDHPVWFGLAAWWLKPLYDRLPLFHLSRAAFGARPTLKETLREWPRLWSRFLLSALLLRRLSFIRSFALPVWMLEGQRGRSVGKRLAALAADGGGSGAIVTWVFLKLEIAAWLGLMALASSFGPTGDEMEWGEIIANPEGFMESSDAQTWRSNIVYLVAMTMMEPFYVGAGFGLYLNSRTKIEGWDVELSFRRLAARLRPVVTAVVMLLTGLLTAGGMAMAQEPPDEKEVKTVLEEILAQEEFKEHTRTQKMWVPDDLELKDVNMDEDAFHWLGMIFYGVMIALVAWLVALAVRWLILNKHLFGLGLPGKKNQTEESGPRVVMGLDIAKENLPDDLIAAARTAWAAGQVREALSLLYRGALSRLVEQRRLRIRDSDTEDDCLMKVAEMGDVPVTDFFRRLTMIWVRAAYAGEEAQESEFDRLCLQWPFQQHPASQGRKLAGMRGAGLFLLVLIPALAGCKGHWEDVTLPLGYKGKARTDPFLAAQRLLEEYGHEAMRKPAFNSLPESDNGVVILSGEAGIPEARARQLLEWVEDGGHLVYALAGCAPYNDWGLFGGMSTFGYTGNEERPDPVLEKLGIQVEGGAGLDAFKKAVKDQMSGKGTNKEADEDVKENEESKKIKTPEDVLTIISEVALDEDTYQVEFPAVHTLSIDRLLTAGESHTGTLEKATLLDLWHGLGRVTVISHARPLRNRYLDENDHARWLLALLEGDSREVHFIVSLQSSFLSLLWTRAWMPLMGLALVTVVWLWLNMPRFGPMRQVELHDTKHFTEHISALGQFFYRLKRGDVLLNAAADAVRARAIRKHPYLAQMNDEALVQLLAEASTMPAARIQAAFVPEAKVPAHEMLRRLQDLQKLKAAL